MNDEEIIKQLKGKGYCSCSDCIEVYMQKARADEREKLNKIIDKLKFGKGMFGEFVEFTRLKKELAKGEEVKG